LNRPQVIAGIDISTCHSGMSLAYKRESGGDSLAEAGWARLRKYGRDYRNEPIGKGSRALDGGNSGLYPAHYC
jgi:hypothetical protein